MPTNSPGSKQRTLRKKACNSCATSKVRCNLQKPVCSRCQLTGRPCTYPSSASDQGSRPTEVNSAGVEGPDVSYSNATGLVTPHLDSPVEVPIPVPYEPSPTRTTAWYPSNQSQRLVASPWPDNYGLDFTAIDLVPSTNAGDIRDRWMRPYLLPTGGGDHVPKIYQPFTMHYISRILSTYPRCMLEDGGVPPIIHRAQLDGQRMPRALANCYSLVRMWVQAAPGSEEMVVSTLEKEMKRLTEERLEHDYELLAAFQAYLIYAIMMYCNPLSDSSPVTDETVISLMEMAFRTARNGLFCVAELSHARPTWESWIVVAAKRRAIITMYLLSSVYNAERLLPDFVAMEAKDVFAPGNKALWNASERETWNRAYDQCLSEWQDGMLKISELWKSEETGSAERRRRIERWLRTVDEFGMMLFGVCAHVHGC